MTKHEIVDRLLILKESLKGQAENHYRQSDEPSDYNFGYAQACEHYAKRVNDLYQKIKEELK